MMMIMMMMMMIMLMIMAMIRWSGGDYDDNGDDQVVRW